MGMVKPWHILVLVVVLVLLFGAKKLPGAARGLGQSLRILKSETKTLREEDADAAAKADPKHAREPLHKTTTIEGEATSVHTEKPRDQA